MAMEEMIHVPRAKGAYTAGLTPSSGKMSRPRVTVTLVGKNKYPVPAEWWIERFPSGRNASLAGSEG